MKLKITVLSVIVLIVSFSYSQNTFIHQLNKNQLKELKKQKVISGERLKYYKRFVVKQRSKMFIEIDSFLKKSDTIFIYEHLDEIDEGLYEGWVWNKRECYQYVNKYVNGENVDYCKISFDTVELFAKNHLNYCFLDSNFKKVNRNKRYTSSMCGGGIDVYIKVIKKASGNYYFESGFFNGFNLFSYKRMTFKIANPVNNEIVFFKNILWGIEDKEFVVITLDSEFNEKSRKDESYIMENPKTPFYFKFSNDTLDVIGCEFQIPDSVYFKTPIRFLHTDSLEINNNNQWYKENGCKKFIPISLQ